MSKSVASPAVSEESFPALIARAQQGERGAIEALFSDLQPRLLRYFRMSARREADDLAAEVWMSIARDFGRFEGDLGGFRGWVFTIAHRRLSDHRRRLSRRPPEVLTADSIASWPAPDDAERGVVDRLSGQAAAELVARLLPEDQADVVLLRILADLDVSDVAQVMGRSENWVRVTQHRGLRRLAGLLGDRSLVIA